MRMWVKTDAGRAEMQTRALVKERPLRNLLLLIDGSKSDAVLLTSVSGVSLQEIESLQALGLIEQTPGRATAPAPLSASSSSPRGAVTAPAPLSAASPSQHPAPPTTYAEFTAMLTKLISTHLGLRGLPLTLALEKAATVDDLRDVARRVVEQIRSRRGPAVAHLAEQQLFGL
jgi:hypothetical protein